MTNGIESFSYIYYIVDKVNKPWIEWNTEPSKKDYSDSVLSCISIFGQYR